MAFHQGELYVQERAQVRKIAERNQKVYESIPPIAQSFLQEQPFLLLSASDSKSQMWAAPLFGPPGFLQASDSQTLAIHASLDKGNPIQECLQAGQQVGTLAIDFQSRRRMRLNGRINRVEEGVIEIHTEEVYGNCPKYIQARQWILSPLSEASSVGTPIGNLPTPLADMIEQSDTFFIATSHASSGADISHRGGMPGFCQVEQGRVIRFPDYKGNAMFNTLGNLHLNPKAGLLFLDYATGDVIQLTGVVETEWLPAADIATHQAERMIHFHIEEGWYCKNGMPLKWDFHSYSPANPVLVKSR